MKILLDTSVYSQPIKKKPLLSVVSRWKARPESDYAVSSVCELAVLYGIRLSESESLKTAYKEILLGRFPILPFDERCAAKYAELQAASVKKGATRPAFDLMIASTAIVHNLELATCNPRSFEGIAGLVVQDWNAE